MGIFKGRFKKEPQDADTLRTKINNLVINDQYIRQTK